jgi:Methyltransferase domain
MFDWRSYLKAIPGARPMGRWLRGAAHPHYRAVRMVERSLPGQMLQPEATTGEGRYPEIIGFVAQELAQNARPSVLSWGCSTGAELLALHKAMPHANITGVDINPRSVALAARAVGGIPQIRLLRSGDPAELAGQFFDAVLCLAVLRHARLEDERPEICSAILPFARAERFVAGLGALVRPGGLLALWNVHFRLADMAAAADFTAVLKLEKGARANQPLYGPGDHRLDGELCRSAVYRRC